MPKPKPKPTPRDKSRLLLSRLVAFEDVLAKQSGARAHGPAPMPVVRLLAGSLAEVRAILPAKSGQAAAPRLAVNRPVSFVELWLVASHARLALEAFMRTAGYDRPAPAQDYETARRKLVEAIEARVKDGVAARLSELGLPPDKN